MCVYKKEKVKSVKQAYKQIQQINNVDKKVEFLKEAYLIIYQEAAQNSAGLHLYSNGLINRLTIAFTSSSRLIVRINSLPGAQFDRG